MAPRSHHHDHTHFIGQTRVCFAGRRVELRVSQAEITAVVLDTGELACRHRRSFAGGLTVCDPAHQSELERQRARRRGRHEVEVEIRPLARYDALIPA